MSCPRVVSQSQLRCHVGAASNRPHHAQEAASTRVFEEIHHTSRCVEDLIARAVLCVVCCHVVRLRTIDECAVHVGDVSLGDSDIRHGVVLQGPDLHRIVARGDGEARIPEYSTLGKPGKVIEANVEQVVTVAGTEVSVT